MTSPGEAEAGSVERGVEEDGSWATVNTSGRTCKKQQPGIVYLSVIPPFMTVKKLREIFSQYGQVGRIYLQPEQKQANGRKASRHFSEGWVEMKSKKIAKMISVSLNNKQLGGKRKSKFYDFLWNIKYLHRFKWTHLSERLAYEKAVHDQRMRTEISQVKRETNFYTQALEKSKKLQRVKKKKQQRSQDWEERHVDVKQRTVHADALTTAPVAKNQVSVLTSLRVFGK